MAGKQKFNRVKAFKIHSIVLIILTLIVTLPAMAHPTGNMIQVGEKVLWSYIHPVDDPNHHACIMIAGKDSEPELFLKSEYPASDYMLSHKGNEIYIIERRYLQARQEFETRILKSKAGEEPTEIWSWFKDEWRLGEGGFFMVSDTQIVFGSYPEVYSLTKGGTPTKYFGFSDAVKRIRDTENNQILLLGNKACYLVQHDGTIVKQWDELIDKAVTDAPLNRNQVFDADYHKGKLLLAYWGQRSFVMIDESGKRNIIWQQTEPLTPHWVSFWGDKLLLFSSEFIFDGSTPRPHLVLFKGPGNKQIIWSLR